MIKAIKLIDFFFKFERASFRSSGARGVDRLLVIGRRDALVKERFRYRESRYGESRVYMRMSELSELCEAVYMFQMFYWYALVRSTAIS